MRRASPPCLPRPGLTAPLLTLLLLLPPAARAEQADPTDKRRNRAVELEKRGAWLEACRAWDDLLRRDRQNAQARDGYQRCQRRLQLALRHTDSAYQQAVGRLAPPQALEVYEQVLTILHVGYADRSRVGFQQLFRQGLHEVKLALDDALFRRLYLPGAKEAAVRAFRARLASWPDRPIVNSAEAREQALEVIRSAARDGLSLRAAAVSALALEFAAGACNTLDDFSSFLSPGHLAVVQAALRGKLLGVGVEVGMDDDDRLRITRVYPKGPAEELGLQVGDRVVRIAGVPTELLPPDVAAERLRGEAGSAIEVEVERDGEDGRAVRLVRRAVAMPSVEVARLQPLDDGTPAGRLPVGLIKIHHFQDSTLQEVKEAILELNSSTEPVKGIILDLRGNPGGVFKSSVAVAELFVHGVIVVGQSPFKEYNRPFRSESGGPVSLPMVVMIDGETASAAEVLAGALQAGRAGTKLLGQTTYGKGSIQCIIPMDKSPLDGLAGIKLTVARLFSPTNQPYTGRGVTPDVASAEKGERLVAEARKLLLELLRPGQPMPRVVAMDMTPNPS